ncbi:squalene--hopene cyclase [Candidatus Nitronereus thalassa]|uniref:Squalene--hopene cyclase n=1 Tax=Candidatus Nitronereus thalassa TaxID=3020898 RepID=A0ABU3KAP5_9BACT|nr:squalene--hopene cyclase [Candidatus Nitronereus thalassa]MDT7043544.1 squalene--hopene cyclase [Candidatus Nitronereus thalassa]
MDLFKNILGRLSDSFFTSVQVGLKSRPRKRKSPSLKLVSDNPNPVPMVEPLLAKSGHSPVGHAEAIEETLQRSKAWLLSQQDVEEGFWVEELEADTTLTSEYLMLRRYLGLADAEREAKAIRYLQHTQLEDGGWPIFNGGPIDISASVKAYFALKLAGVSQDEPYMQKARQVILDKGGVVSANVFTKITLALFGQYDWRGIPSMPPEIILAPKGFYFNLYAVSYWSRVVIVPLLIIFAFRRTCEISPEEGIDELFLIPRDQVQYRVEPPFQKDRSLCSWRNFFVWVDGILKVYEQYPINSLRKRAIKKAEAWMLEHMEGDGGIGAIYPAMANSVFALCALGYPTTHPLIAKALREIEALEIETPITENGQCLDRLHMQPCHSPVWDTALTLNTLIEAGLPLDHPALLKGASWLRSCQTSTVGDWIVSSPSAKPGGWYFQFENEWYPDVDDTAAVVTALTKLSPHHPADVDEAVRRGSEWALAMQSSNGGWGAYDKNNDRLIFNRIPFADHQALLDPPTSDLTGRCLEMLGTFGYDQSHPSVAPALEFLRKEQEDDGSWYGRWGVNYLYGTWCVLAGLEAIGEDMSSPWIQKAVAWLESKQNVDGGWGESCTSYADPSWSGEGESTASQTAWALMALLSAGVADSLSVVRGVNYLLRHQQSEGTWQEPFHTGTGFPRVFYLRYHGYSKYFPMWALAMYRNVRSHGCTRAEEIRHKAQLSRRPK